MLGKFLDPKNDFAFKRVFGTEKNKDILIHFLNDILDHQYIGQITAVTFLDPVQAPEVAAKKQSIVDVLCQDQRGMQYIVEMQVTDTAGFEKRAQYYAAKAYSGQLFEGDDDNHLREVIFLAITNFLMFPEQPAIKSDHIILDRITYAHKLKDFTFTFVELPKFTKQSDELRTMSEKWYYYLKHAPETSPETYFSLVKDAPALKRAYDELERFSWSVEALARYEQITKRDRDNAAALRAKVQKAEQKGREEGREEGIAIGEERGIEKGKALGKEEGIAMGKKEGMALGEKSAKQSMARQMLQDGEPVEKIVRWTRLSEASIRNL